jgi:hypothetical protein
MEEHNASTPPTRLELAFVHWWQHLALGAVGSSLLMSLVVVVPWIGQGVPAHWQNMLLGGAAMVLISCVGAALVGLVRVPAMGWIMDQAQQRQWPMGKLLLASATLFLIPVLLIFLLGKTWQLVGWISLALSLPFFMAYVAATYRLRERIYALPVVDL